MFQDRNRLESLLEAAEFNITAYLMTGLPSLGCPEPSWTFPGLPLRLPWASFKPLLYRTCYQLDTSSDHSHFDSTIIPESIQNWANYQASQKATPTSRRKFQTAKIGCLGRPGPASVLLSASWASWASLWAPQSCALRSDNSSSRP